MAQEYQQMILEYTQAGGEQLDALMVSSVTCMV